MSEPDAIEGIRAFLEKRPPRWRRLGSDSMSPELANLIAHAQAVERRLRSDAVRSWKEAAPGRKAIGHMPIYVPRELIHAAGMLPVGIVGAGRAIGDHPRRRLFPELHLPYSAQHRRTRSQRTARCAGRHVVSLHLRCHPQPCQACGPCCFPNATSATWICRRILMPRHRGRLLAPRTGDTARGLRPPGRPSDRRCGLAAQHRRVQREPLRDSRTLSRPQPPAVALSRPPKFMCCCAAGKSSAGRSHRAAAGVSATGARWKPTVAIATRAEWCWWVRSANSRRWVCC